MTKVCNFKDIKTYTRRYNKKGKKQEIPINKKLI